MDDDRSPRPSVGCGAARPSRAAALASGVVAVAAASVLSLAVPGPEDVAEPPSTGNRVAGTHSDAAAPDGRSPSGPESSEPCVAGLPTLVVTDATGRPATGVPVEVFDPHWSRLASGRSDRRGVVRLDEDPDVGGLSAVRVVAGDGLASPRVECVVRIDGDAASPAATVVLPDAADVRVEVTVGGAAGRDLCVEATSGRGIRAEVDSTGCAALKLTPGRWQFTVTGAGFVLDRRQVRVGRGPLRVPIELPRLARVLGRVVDSSGRGVSGVAVTVSSGSGCARVISRPDGSFHGPRLPAGSTRLSALHPPTGVGSVLTSTADGDETHAVLVLRPGRRLRVVAAASTGEAPIAGLVSWKDPETLSTTAAAPLAAGAAVLDHAAAGQRLRIDAAGFVPEEIELDEGVIRRGVLHVDLRSAREIRGRLLRADGTILVGYEVALAPADAGEPADWTLSTARDGTFALCGVPEGFAVLAVRSGDRAQRFQVRVTRDGDVGDLCLR